MKSGFPVDLLFVFYRSVQKLISVRTMLQLPAQTSTEINTYNAHRSDTRPTHRVSKRSLFLGSRIHIRQQIKNLVPSQRSRNSLPTQTSSCHPRDHDRRKHHPQEEVNPQLPLPHRWRRLKDLRSSKPWTQLGGNCVVLFGTYRVRQFR